MSSDIFDAPNIGEAVSAWQFVKQDQAKDAFFEADGTCLFCGCQDSAAAGLHSVVADPTDGITALICANHPSESVCWKRPDGRE